MEGTSTGTPGVISKAGAPETGVPTKQVVATPATETPTPAVTPENGGAATPDPNKPNTEGGAAAPDAGAAGAAAPAVVPDITDEQLKEMLKAKGIEGFENLDGLKSLVTKATAPAPPELTPEEKTAAALQLENRMLNLYLEKGGKAEDFVAIKQVVAADAKDLSLSELKRELKENGFDDSEIDSIIKERYYALDPATLTKGEDESEADFAKRKAMVEKKVAYGTKKLEGRSKHIKNEAESVYNGMKKAIENEDLQKRQQAEFASKVDAFAATLPRKMTVELGKSNDQDIAPVEYTVTEEDITAVVSTLKDPAKLKQTFYNPDGNFNLESVGKLLLRNQILESQLKVLYLEGGDRQVKAFEAKFGGKDPKDIGVGGPASTGATKKGQIAKAGTPQVASRQQ